MPWRQTPSRKKKTVMFTNVTANAYQGRLKAEFSKVCEIFKVCANKIFKICLRVSHTGLLSWRHCHALKRDVNETNCDCLFDMLVKRPHRRALTNECSHLFQTFSRQSECLATRDYCKHTCSVYQLLSSCSSVLFSQHFQSMYAWSN